MRSRYTYVEQSCVIVSKTLPSTVLHIHQPDSPLLLLSSSVSWGDGHVYIYVVCHLLRCPHSPLLLLQSLPHLHCLSLSHHDVCALVGNDDGTYACQQHTCYPGQALLLARLHWPLHFPKTIKTYDLRVSLFHIVKLCKPNVTRGCYLEHFHARSKV